MCTDSLVPSNCFFGSWQSVSRWPASQVITSENFCQVFCHCTARTATFSASGISFLSSHTWHAKPVPLISGFFCFVLFLSFVLGAPHFKVPFVVSVIVLMFSCIKELPNVSTLTQQTQSSSFLTLQSSVVVGMRVERRNAAPCSQTETKLSEVPPSSRRDSQLCSECRHPASSWMTTWDTLGARSVSGVALCIHFNGQKPMICPKFPYLSREMNAAQGTRLF